MEFKNGGIIGHRMYFQLSHHRSLYKYAIIVIASSTIIGNALPTVKALVIAEASSIDEIKFNKGGYNCN